MRHWKAQEDNPQEIARGLLDDLPGLAKILIEARPENDNFKENPDDPKEHDPCWHQFGIITHTGKFNEFYWSKVRKYSWHGRVHKVINKRFSTKIDGKKKGGLLQISIVLHGRGNLPVGIGKKREG